MTRLKFKKQADAIDDFKQKLDQSAEEIKQQMQQMTDNIQKTTDDFKNELETMKQEQNATEAKFSRLRKKNMMKQADYPETAKLKNLKIEADKARATFNELENQAGTATEMLIKKINNMKKNNIENFEDEAYAAVDDTIDSIDSFLSYALKDLEKNLHDAFVEDMDEVKNLIENK